MLNQYFLLDNSSCFLIEESSVSRTAHPPLKTTSCGFKNDHESEFNSIMTQFDTNKGV